MSSSDGSWISCCQRGDVLELEMASGYWRMRHACSCVSVGGSASHGASSGLCVPWAVGVGGGVGWLAWVATVWLRLWSGVTWGLRAVIKAGMAWRSWLYWSNIAGDGASVAAGEGACG